MFGKNIVYVGVHANGNFLFVRAHSTYPLVMVFYAIATLPLIKRGKIEELLGKAWFADDVMGQENR